MEPNDEEIISLRILTDLMDNNPNYEKSIKATFFGIKNCCEEYANKKQKFMKFCLYSKFKKMEKDSENQIDYFSIKKEEEKAIQDFNEQKAFITELSTYTNALKLKQDEMTKKLLDYKNKMKNK